MQTVNVNLSDRRYQIAIAAGLIDDAGTYARTAVGENARSAVVVSNPSVHGLYGARLERSLKTAGFRPHRVLVEDGERFKSLKSADHLYSFLIDRHIERGDVILALGGGVVGDLAGFVAATYLRGIRIVQIPTTLLAQIDSSIGGKTGVNHRLGKNLIGAFHQPALVLIDPEVLASLPERQLRSGLFEAIKYGVIRDRKMFVRTADNMRALKCADAEEITALIVSSCRIKAAIVGSDERESGLRRILNFGHTVGHAIEAITNYRKFLHGEAVGCGMRAACRIAELIGLFESSDRRAVDQVIASVGPVPGTRSLALGDIMVAMKRDKKVEGGKLAFILPVAIGDVVVRSDVAPLTMRKAIRDTLG